MNKLALELHVPATRIGEIVHERRRITAETALRLARYFHNNAEFWLNLQNFYDLEVSRRSGKASEIEHQVTPAPSLTLDTACARRRIEFETPEGSVRKHLNVRTKAKSARPGPEPKRACFELLAIFSAPLLQVTLVRVNHRQ